MNRLKIGIRTLGCRVNQYESDAIAEEFERLGHTVAEDADELCDIYVVNTCTVTAESDRKSRQYIRRCAALNPDGVVVVTGCFAQNDPKSAASIPGVTLVIGNREKSTVVARALAFYENRENAPLCFVPPLAGATFDRMTITKPGSRTRAFVKIEDGCENKCAYCAIPAARGPIRSKEKDDVIAEVKAILAGGCPEIVLTGIEVASYGKDLKDGEPLADLITEIDKLDGIRRIRLGSLDPAAVTEGFVTKLASCRHVMPHFHLSMQSGSSATLARMRRRYNAKMAKENIERLRRAFPDLMLSADLIVGFPGETEEEFDETLRFFRDEPFLHIHAFPYSRRRGTEADTMSRQIPSDVKRERLAWLFEQQSDIHATLIRDFIRSHPETEVLFETTEDGYLTGHTENFIEVRVPGSESLKGRFGMIRTVEEKSGYCYGKLE